ncbi:hypothetical protein [Ruminococcus albus]|uniref:Uncharacterized protein n=1 Tax=Ruminococcus albus TaxID=1264 RepID=A0A1I1PLI3_RUMAL|nr:hypothetical protein [Ruminococcus albus]SFD10651.1 hypothetical protein SAMN02910406_03117 [Ruminococcus albus]
MYSLEEVKSGQCNLMLTVVETDYGRFVTDEYISDDDLYSSSALVDYFESCDCDDADYADIEVGVYRYGDLGGDADDMLSDDVRAYIEYDIESFLSKCDPLETNTYEVNLRELLGRDNGRGY